MTQSTLQQLVMLDGRIFAMLDHCEQEIVDYFLYRGRKHGLRVSFVNRIRGTDSVNDDLWLNYPALFASNATVLVAPVRRAQEDSASGDHVDVAPLETMIEGVLQFPWLQQGLQSASRRDPVDAVNDAEILRSMLLLRATCVPWHSVAEGIIHNPESSRWLVAQLCAALRMEPVVAYDEAACLYGLLKHRVAIGPASH